MDGSELQPKLQLSDAVLIEQQVMMLPSSPWAPPGPVPLEEIGVAWPTGLSLATKADVEGESDPSVWARTLATATATCAAALLTARTVRAYEPRRYRIRRVADAIRHCPRNLAHVRTAFGPLGVGRMTLPGGSCSV